SLYPVAGNENHPDFGIAMDPDNSNYTAIFNAIPDTVADGGTNIRDAIIRTRTMLDNGKRPGTNGAIVLFTDGAPTAPFTHFNPVNPANVTASYAEADVCKARGYTLYTIGLAQNDAIVPLECDVLNDGAGKTITYTNQAGATQHYTPSVDGIAKRGADAPPGRFYLVTNGQNLRYVFENLARRLCTLVKVF
ncbi:MAG: VWA domain-containing protein, partial [Cyanobacteria bacterium]|nr:VWA domain-containing protein [Cyanobacteriota bacterium]